MKLKGKFKNLKTGAKRVFVGMLILCILSSATGIGSIFVYADEVDETLTNTNINTDNNNTTIDEHIHAADEQWHSDVSGHWHECTAGDGEKIDFSEHTLNWVAESETTEVEKCSVCGYVAGTRTAESEPVVTGQDTVDVAHIHTVESYTSIDEMDHEGVCTDPGCGQTVTEPHNMGDWEETPDGSKHTRTCRKCEYTETHDAGTDTTGTCAICNPDALNTYTLDTDSLDILGDTLAFSMLKTTPASTTNEGNGPARFEDLFAELPNTVEGLVYDGKEHELFTNFNETTGYPGKLKTRGELESLYRIVYDSCEFVSSSSSITRKGTNAGEYTTTLFFKYTAYVGIGDETRDFTVSGTYKTTIAPASFKDTVSIPEDTSYVANDHAEPYYTPWFNGHAMYSGFKYTTSGKFDSIPAVGDSVTVTFSRADDNTNFDDSTITRTVTVAAVPVTFNGSSTQKSVYVDSVYISAYDQNNYKYLILGPSGGFYQGATFTSAPSDGYLYFDPSDHAQNKVKLPVNFKIVKSDELTIDDLMISYPEFNETMTYTGEKLTLMSKAPAFLSDEDLAALKIDQINWWFSKTEDDKPYPNISPTESEIGLHEYSFHVQFINTDGVVKEFTDTKKYSTTIIKDLSHSEITYTAQANDYQSLDISTALEDFYKIVDTGTSKQLVKNADYTVEVSPITSYYESGTAITLTINGVKSKYYTGTVTKTIPVSKIDVKLNGAAQVSKYDDSVVFTADGYTISDSATGTFTSEYKYSTPCEKLELPLYFKKNGRVVKQTIKDLNIGEAAGITLLYDGSSELKPLYHDSVRISAEGYTVSATQTGTYSDSYVLSYDASKNMTPVDTFSLYFKDKSTGGVYQKNISGINLAETPGKVTVLYNGASQKEWYNANVTITGTEVGTTNKCTISDSKDGTYTSNYVMTGSGLVSKKLYFKNSAGTVLNDGNPYTIVVNIDRTAPTGTITLNGATSSSFKSTDSTVGYANSSQKASISASDDVSGVETIKYYASETFYSSSSDLIAGMSEKSGAWRTYSSSSAPQLVKDKNNYIYVAITDKAGNTGYISLGSIIYDTVAPTVTTATVTDSADGKSKVLVIAGTDELSGINRFKLMYFEKDEAHQPSKDEIFDMGIYITTSQTSGKEAGATYTIEGLESGKTYMFYVASVDRAGNVSDVKAIEGEGTTAAEAAAAKAAADAAAAQAAASSALAAAPNGLAGGNSGQPKTGPEASSQAQAQEETEEERVISRDPYIAEATGSTQIGPINTSGWDKIKSEIKKADNGTQMSVEMSGVSEVPLSVLKEVADRDDLEVTFLINDGVEWTIKGASITDEGIKDVDLGVKMGSKNIPAKVSSDVVGSYQHVDFAVNEEGELGFTATISVPVGTSNAGMNATLYYYNPEKNELEAQKASVVDDNGRAKFEMTHCSDYTIVITPEKLLSDSEVSYSVTRSDTLTSGEIFDGTRIRLADLFGVSGRDRIWLFIIAAISAALCVAILYFPGLQKEEGN